MADKNSDYVPPPPPPRGSRPPHVKAGDKPPVREPDEVIPAGSTKALIPIDESDYTKALPTDRETCFRIMEGNVTQMTQLVTERMWHIGRILNELELRKEKDVLKEAARRVGYAERTLTTAKAFNSRFPKFSDVRGLVDKKFEWNQLRQLTSIKKEDNLQLLKTKIDEGQISKDELPQVIREVAAKERQEEGKSDGRSKEVKSKQTDIVAVFAKAAGEVTRMKTELLKLSKDMFGSGPKDQTAWLGILIEDTLTKEERFQLAKKHVVTIQKSCQELGATAADMLITLKREVPQ